MRILSLHTSPRGLLTAGIAAVLALGCTAAAAQASTSPAGPARVTPSTSPLRLTALKFGAASVDATTGTATVSLTWTIRDGAREPGKVSGNLQLAAPAKRAGHYLTEIVPVRFAGRGTASGATVRYRFSYVFDVPQWAQASSVGWQVVRLSARDSRHNVLEPTAQQLGAFGATLTATELVDTTPPSYSSLQLLLNESPARPYVYTAPGDPGAMTYEFAAGDAAGVSYGSIEVTGPRGHHLSAGFRYNAAQGSCGAAGDSGGPDGECAPTVVFPPGTLAGTWKVATLTLTDTAGNTATFTGIDGLPVSVTSDQLIHASHFRASPDPVNDWTSTLTTVQLRMQVTGARGGISAIDVDTQAEGANCVQGTGAPTVSGTTVSVPVTVYQGMQLCQIYGVAIIDGKGDISLYGQEYSAPDPYLLIRQLPDTTPPTVSAASISPASVASSQSGSTQLALTLDLNPSIAPVDGFSFTLYDAAGQQVTSEAGGASPYQGALTVYLPLPAGLTPGTYTAGFSITDKGSLTTTYGPDGLAVPGGPLTLTVTSG